MAGREAKYKAGEAAGVKKITALQTHDNCDISKLATETYFADRINLSLCITCYLLCLNESCFHILNPFLLYLCVVMNLQIICNVNTKY